MIDIEFIRKYCLSFPGSFEQLQWESSLLFKVGPKSAGKIFLIYSLYEGTQNRISLKCTHEKFEELTDLEYIIPAPYLAHNKWVTLQDGCRLKTAELKELIELSYNLVFSKLTKKIRAEIYRKMIMGASY